MTLMRAILACTLLFLSVYADTTCTDYIDATTSTNWVKGSANPFYQLSYCTFDPTTFNQVTTSDPPVINLYATSSSGSSNSNLCEKAFIPQTSFGVYNCNMKVPGVAGTVTSCLVESTSVAPYENIYFKFFGNDTTRVYIGFFSNGMVNQAGPVPITFDPTAQFHQYTMEYHQSYIKWIIDGKEVSSEYGYRPIPQDLNRFSIGLVTEEPTFIGEDTQYPTDPSVDRTYSSLTDVVAVFANVTYLPFSGTGCDGSVTIAPDVPTTSTATCTAQSALVIFNDTAQNGFTISSTDSGNSVDTAATYSTYDGVNSIAFTPLRGDVVFYLSNSAFYTSSYYGVAFWFQAGSQGTAVSAYLIQSGGLKTDSVALSTIVTQGFNAGEWTHVVIPFEAFGLSGTVVRALAGFGLTFPNNQDYGKTLYIDGVYLVQQLPMCANQTYYIYNSGLESYIKDNSYGSVSSSVNLAYKGDSYNGTECIRWDILPSNGLSFALQNGPLNTNLWKAISMRIKFGNTSSDQWSMYFTSPDSTAQYRRAGANPLNLFDYLGGVVPQGQYPRQDWPLIVIPFNDFGITNNINLDGIVIASDASNGYQGTLYFDEIAFITNIPANVQSQSSSASFVHVSTFVTFAFALVYLFL